MRGLGSRGRLILAVLAASAAAAPSADASDARYRLAGGCYVLHSEAREAPVAKIDGGYAAGTAPPERFRMQATALGRYLFYGRDRDFLAVETGPGEDRRVSSAAEPGPHADWVVRESGDAFAVEPLEGGGRLAVDPGTGGLVLEPAAAGARSQAFHFVPDTGCAEFPEAEVNARGRPARGPAPHAEVRGLLDTHFHLMAFNLAGGGVHCGLPWSPYGITRALVDCPDHEPNGEGAVVENLLSNGSPVGTHDTDGWPTFEGWPTFRSKSHEQGYYKWVERAWRGGLRLMTDLLVEQETACKVYPIKRYPCDDWATIQREARQSYELQDYIDAQSGGPGRGWFRIVKSPFEARRVINQGKLAVVLGIETSEPFNCGVYNDQPDCTRAELDARFRTAHRLGVRQLELINKVDNAFGGVAMDADPLEAMLSNTGNRLETGRYFRVERCAGHEHDRPQPAVPGSGPESLQAAVIQAFAPSGAAPLYAEPPHCNARGLSTYGEHLLRRAMTHGMMLDPDHLSVHARNQMLSLLEAERYSGVLSSHSWSTSRAYERILRLGGVVTPISDPSKDFVEDWRRLRAVADDRYLFGFGVGSDTGGFHEQPAPRGPSENPVTYPFKSIDGSVTLDRQRSGRRTYDVNVDGVAHYGLYPDWVEELRKVGGDAIVEDMALGPEAYLQSWERANGVPGPRCVAALRVGGRGIGRVRLGDRPQAVLFRAGQPAERGGRVWRWCAGARRGGAARAAAVFTPSRRVGLVATSARRTRALGVRPGDPVRRLRDRARRMGPGLAVARDSTGRRFFFGLGGGRVGFVATASRALQESRPHVRRYLRLAGLLPLRRGR